jgi:dihydroorotate dehydrogenase
VSEWQRDAKQAVESAGEGQVMVMSFMGTVREGQTPDEFVADYVAAAEASLATGASILETNLSCPNIGNEGLVCYNSAMTARVAEAIRKVIVSVPLILKIGYFSDESALREITAVAAHHADGISAINTVQATIVDEKGEQALPGKNRSKSGVCGNAIKWAGLDMVRRLEKARSDSGEKFAIIGCGGVTIPQDFREFRDAGADVVMSATGAMWNPYLAKEIREMYPKG